MKLKLLLATSLIALSACAVYAQPYPTALVDQPTVKDQCAVWAETAQNHLKSATCAAGGVSSFNSRTGAVTPQTGDYTAAQVTNAASGPGSATSGNFPSFNGTGGKTLQDSTYSPSSFAPASSVHLVTGSNPTILVANWANADMYTITGTGRTLTLPATSTLSPNGALDIGTNAGPVTFTANAADTIAFNGVTGSAGGSVVLPQGSLYRVTSDGAGHIYISGRGACITPLTAVSNVFTPDGSCNNYSLTLGATNTLANWSAGMTPGTSGWVKFVQDGTGGRTVGTWGSQIISPGGTASNIFSAGAAAIDMYSYTILDTTHVWFAPAGLNASH